MIDLLQRVGYVFELIVIIIAIILLILILIKYLTKKHKLTLYLFIIFLNLTLAIIFSWLSKVFYVHANDWGLNYLFNESIPAPDIFQTWFIYRIAEFRISFVFFAIGMYYSYILKVKLFEKGYKTISRLFMILYFIFTVFFSFFIYIRGNIILDVIAFFLNFLFVVIVYIPLTYETYQSYRITTIPAYKKGFLSLSIMGIFFILILMCFLFDRILILLGGPGFSVFYFLAWIFAILGIFSAYLGYIQPK